MDGGDRINSITILLVSSDIGWTSDLGWEERRRKEEWENGRKGKGEGLEDEILGVTPSAAIFERVRDRSATKIRREMDVAAASFPLPPLLCLPYRPPSLPKRHLLIYYCTSKTNLNSAAPAVELCVTRRKRPAA
jgi:hypothetical protein